MHILMISDVYFPRVNGVSTSIKIFIGEHQKLGNKVTLVCPDYTDKMQIDYDVEHAIIRLPARHVLFDPEDRLIKSSHFQGLLDILQPCGIDIIHIQTPFVAHRFGVKLSGILNVPCVETYHTFFEEYFHHYIPLVPKRILRSLSQRFSVRQCNQLDAVIVPSTAMKNVLSDYGVSTEISIIPTGLRISEFEGGDGSRFRKTHGIAANRPLLVFIGRVALEKNIHFLLDMLIVVKRQIPDVLLIIAGEGPARKTLQKYTHKLALADNVMFVGYMSREQELLDCYRAGQAFVFSSRTETQGLVLLEALACGLPVISTAVMGTIDVLDDQEGGCLIANEDVDDFGGKVIKLLYDNRLQNVLRHQASRYIQLWSAPVFARKSSKLYHQLIQEEKIDNDLPSLLPEPVPGQEY
ncbi:MAG TPA: glycosyltransferase family 4 protein [Gammaproteobacteria bacterium]|nr:glycosyltransferase family 4 protein [Gammaproteobacteria bacterium]